MLNIICFRSDIQEKGGKKSADTTTESIVYKASSVYIQEVVDIPITGKKLEQRTCIDSLTAHIFWQTCTSTNYYVVHLLVLILVLMFYVMGYTGCNVICLLPKL